MDTKQKFITLLGQNVREARVKRKLSIEKLALEAGLAYSQVIRIEQGAISTSAYTIYLLSQALDICPSELYKNTSITP